MKSIVLKYISLIIFLPSLILSAQIPTGYYDCALGLADGDLKYALNQIIDNHTEFSYTSSSIDVWDILKETDRDPNNSDNVILIYSGISINAAQEYNNANGWTREHVWAKSRGDFGTVTGPGTDVISKKPYDGKQVTNDILSIILSIFKLDYKLMSKIKAYQSKDGLQNEKGLEKYIDKILTEKAEKK